MQQAVPGTHQAGADSIPQPQVWPGGSQLPMCPYSPLRLLHCCLRMVAEPAPQPHPWKTLSLSTNSLSACTQHAPLHCKASNASRSPLWAVQQSQKISWIPFKIAGETSFVKIPILKPGVRSGVNLRGLRTTALCVSFSSPEASLASWSLEKKFFYLLF